ncbi:MAG: hypothetical protein QF718_10085 [Phycisphaerales bacterium]|jgi:hypothetical protein|nr:hypothetical protein [Phycisphaerales bacterium]
MNRDRIIQAISAIVALCSVTAGGLLLPNILKEAEENTLRYTNNVVDGAPGWVNTIGMSIGAIRGLLVDYLWIKIHQMKKEGLYFEVMADAELITKLQPRFPQVWVFHAHNMAYNISVATHTIEERWEWVNEGVRLLREKGLRANPDDIVLHKELSFFFMHKLDGSSDDAHLFYKRKFAERWHNILGEPPVEWDARIDWIKEVSDAPRTLDDAIAKTPKVEELLSKLNQNFSDFVKEGYSIKPEVLLKQVSQLNSIFQHSTIAKEVGLHESLRNQSPYFNQLEKLYRDDEYREAWETLIATYRKQVLKDEYNMDPQLMYDYTRDCGPLDWRHPQAHALYWGRRGADVGKGRLKADDIYKVLNTDRIQLQALQALARSGRISYDPFSQEIPGRFPDPRFIDSVIGDENREGLWNELYKKHYFVRGAGSDSFTTFLRNFLGSAVREWYRQGELERAQAMLDKLDSFFGTGATPPNSAYKVPLDVWVKEQTKGKYETMPSVALSDVTSALRYAFRVGVGQDRPEIFHEALKFAGQVTNEFKTNDYYNYTTKFGTGRIKDLIGTLENSAQITFEQLMTDSTIPIEERIAIWHGVDKLEQGLRPRVYDRIVGLLQTQYSRNPLSRIRTFDEAFPKPPGLEAWRQKMAVEAEKQKKLEEVNPSGSIDRK